MIKSSMEIHCKEIHAVSGCTALFCSAGRISFLAFVAPQMEGEDCHPWMTKMVPLYRQMKPILFDTLFTLGLTTDAGYPLNGAPFYAAGRSHNRLVNWLGKVRSRRAYVAFESQVNVLRVRGAPACRFIWCPRGINVALILDHVPWAFVGLSDNLGYSKGVTRFGRCNPWNASLYKKVFFNAASK